MADEQRERLESFRAFIKAAEEGAAIPSVAEDDLRRLHEVAADMAKRRVGKDGMVGVDLMARICSPGANLPAVWFRYTQLRLLIRQGVLAEWQNSADWDDAVYRVAAIIPMNGFQLNQEAFVQRLQHKAAA
jgi:hypothetical protein